MTLQSRYPSIAEAAGYLRQAASLLNREGGIALLLVAFLVAREVLRFVIGMALPDDAVRGGVSLFLTAGLGALFIAAVILKVEAARAGRGIRWVPALEDAGRKVFSLPRRDLAVIGLIGLMMVGVPLAALAGPAEVASNLAAVVILGGAAGATVLLLRRGWARRFLVLVLLLALLFVNYATFLSIGLTSALSGPLIVQPALRAVEGVHVNVTVGNQTAQVPIVFYCVTKAGASTPDLMNCLQANLPPERFQALTNSIGLNNLLILLLAHPSRGLAVVVPLFFVMTRISLAFPAAALEGGLGLRRSWELTGRRYRTAAWLLALAAGGGAVLRLVPGLWLLAVGGGLAGLLILRRAGYGRRVEEAWQEPRVVALLLAAGTGLALAAVPPLAAYAATLFVLGVGGTALTLFHLDLVKGNGGPPVQIPSAE